MFKLPGNQFNCLFKITNRSHFLSSRSIWEVGTSLGVMRPDTGETDEQGSLCAHRPQPGQRVARPPKASSHTPVPRRPCSWTPTVQGPSTPLGRQCGAFLRTTGKETPISQRMEPALRGVPYHDILRRMNRDSIHRQQHRSP